MSKACQLFSGSSGNSIFIASGNARFLVDVGVSAKRIENALLAIGENPSDLSAIFVTHEHTDHIAGLRVFASRYGIPVFADSPVIEKMIHSGAVTDKVNALPLEKNMELAGVEVLPFALSHDSVSCHGYRFNLPHQRSIAVCTDTGYVTDSAREVLPGTDLVFLESNHEITMLQNGYYPYPLKQRILSNHGHLSNEACSLFASDLVQHGTTRLVLSHLSRDNNTPDIARQTTLAALHHAGLREDFDFTLRVSAPENNERPLVL